MGLLVGAMRRHEEAEQQSATFEAFAAPGEQELARAHSQYYIPIYSFANEHVVYIRRCSRERRERERERASERRRAKESRNRRAKNERKRERERECTNAPPREREKEREYRPRRRVDAGGDRLKSLGIYYTYIYEGGKIVATGCLDETT